MQLCTACYHFCGEISWREHTKGFCSIQYQISPCWFSVSSCWLYCNTLNLHEASVIWELVYAVSCNQEIPSSSSDSWVANVQPDSETKPDEELSTSTYWIVAAEDLIDLLVCVFSLYCLWKSLFLGCFVLLTYYG